MKTKKKIAIIGVLIVVLLGAAAVWLFVSGRLAIVWKNPQSVLSVTPRVCGDDIIAKYNSLSKTEGLDAFSAQLKAVNDAVTGLNDANTDPNCVYMQYTYQLFNKEYDKARQSVDTLKQLEQDGNYVTAELFNPQSASSIDETLKAIKQTNMPTSEPTPSTESASPETSNGRG